MALRVDAPRTASTAAPKPETGLLHELAPVGAIALANADGDVWNQAFYLAVAKALPPGVKLFQLLGSDSNFGRPVEDEWSSKWPRAKNDLVTQSLPLDSPWTRDFFPEFVRGADGKVRLVEFEYDYEKSDLAAGRVAKQLKLPVEKVKLSLEGGNLLVDQGRLFVSDKVLERNPGQSREQIVEQLKKGLGVSEVVILPRMPGEMTGHVDLFAKVVGPKTMMVTQSDNPTTEKTLSQTAKVFEKLGYKVVRAKMALEEPGRVAFSYTNTVIVNGVALIPSYGADMPDHPTRKKVLQRDEAAKKAYEALGFKVAQIPSFQLSQKGGSIHCMLHQVPPGVSLPKP